MVGGNFRLKEQSMLRCDVGKGIVRLGDGRSQVGKGQQAKGMRSSCLMAHLECDAEGWGLSRKWVSANRRRGNGKRVGQAHTSPPQFTP